MVMLFGVQLSVPMEPGVTWDWEAASPRLVCTATVMSLGNQIAEIWVLLHFFPNIPMIKGLISLSCFLHPFQIMSYTVLEHRPPCINLVMLQLIASPPDGFWDSSLVLYLGVITQLPLPLRT